MTSSWRGEAVRCRCTAVAFVAVAAAVVGAMLAAPASAESRSGGVCEKLRTGNDRLAFVTEQMATLPIDGREQCASQREAYRYAKAIVREGAAYSHCPQYRRAKRKVDLYEMGGRSRCRQHGR